HSSLCGIKQAAQHFDGCGLAGAVSAEETIDFPIAHLKAYALDSGKAPKLFGEAGGANSGLAAQVAVIVFARKGNLRRLFTQGARPGQKNVFQSWIINTNIRDGDASPAHLLFEGLLSLGRIVYEEIKPIAETLYVDDLAPFARNLG